jgi:phage shock protein PspC (stress-responsive transcriptional regulator)
MTVAEQPDDRETEGPKPPPSSGAVPPPGGGTTATSTVRPPLRRPREGRVLSGVAAGLADHLGVDVAIVRIVIVVLAVVTEGLMVLAYIAAAIFVPAAEPGAPRPDQYRGGGGDGERDPLFWVGIGVLVVGAIWLTRGAAGVTIFPGGPGFGGLVVPLVLIGFGLALWRAGDRREHDTSYPVPGAAPYPPSSGRTYGPSYGPASGPTYRNPPSTYPQPPAFAASTERPMTTETQTPPYTSYGDPDATYPSEGAGGTPPPPPGTGQPYGEPAWTPPPAPEPRERSLLTRVTLGIAFVVVGILWSLRVADVVSIGWGAILAAALLVIGIGLLVSSVFGRGRWLILAGALLTPFVVVSQVAPFPYLADGWDIDGRSAGEIRSTPADLTELRPEYQLGAGSVHLDLTELELDGDVVTVGVDVGAGEIEIVVPDDVEVDVTARSGIGQVRLFDARDAAGIGAGEQQANFVPEGESRGRIELELQAGLGEIRVETEPAGTDGFDTLEDPDGDAESDPGSDTETTPESETEPELDGEVDPDRESEFEPEPAGSDV